MLAKIMSEMPLPMPRWVISSPSHMTMSRADRQRQDDEEEAERRRAAPCRERAVAAWKRKTKPMASIKSQGDGEVAGVLVDLLLPRRTLFHEGFQARADHGQELHDDGRGDVGHDAHGEDGHPLQAAAGEEVDRSRTPLRC